MSEIYKQVIEEKFKLYITPVFFYIPLVYVTLFFAMATFTLFSNHIWIAKIVTIIPMSLVLTRAHKGFNDEVIEEYIKQEVEEKNLKRDLYLRSLIQSIIASSLIYLFVG